MKNFKEMLDKDLDRTFYNTEEFAELQKGVLSKFEPIREITFNGEPFNYPDYNRNIEQTAEKQKNEKGVLKNMNDYEFAAFIVNRSEYDNGNRDYSYNNGLIFEPVTEEVLQKFPNKREELKGFKYKRFDMEEFKGMLSMPTRDEINRSKGKSRDSSAQKFSRDKPLTEKYKVFSDFEKNVLAMVKSEINEMTDLWFDYEPVRRRGVRKYEFLYIFIKYKNREEMKSVRAFHQEHKGADTEVSRKPRKRRSSVSKEALEQYDQPLKEAILTATYRLARNELAVKAQYQTYEKKLTPEERNIFIDIFTYTSKILTNTKKRDQAEETLEALNRIIKDNNGLKTWALGMSVKYKAMLERAKERKSAQYYRTVVYNDIIENSAAIIADGTKRAALLDGDRTDLFKFDWSQFDE